jgi:hypothetical protein
VIPVKLSAPKNIQDGGDNFGFPDLPADPIFGCGKFHRRRRTRIAQGQTHL